MSDTPPIVIDTNIYISTAISPNGTVAQALKKAELTGSPIIQTPQTMAELEEKLITNPSEKILRLVPEDRRHEIYQRALAHGTLIEAAPNFTASRDIKDNMFVDAAIAGRAEYIISADKDLLTLKNVPAITHQIQIVEPNSYVRHMQAREDLNIRRAKLAQSTEHHAAHGVGVASAVVNAAQGNYGAAAIDTAGLVAENHAVQQAAVETAAKLGLRETFTVVAKHIPLVGGLVTLGFVAYEVGAHALDGEYKLAGAALAAGTAEAAGNVFGPLGVGDAAREAVRGGFIATGGDEYAAVQKSGLRELGEGTYAITTQALSKPEGKPLAEVLPPNHASMAQGSDAIGDRSEISRIAVERTGLAANDPGNNMSVLMRDANRPTGHLLVLEDGKVQGPESGAVPFASNPQIAAGKNGGTLGILYAGTGAMNDAQWNTVSQVRDWLGQQRGAEGLSAQTELIAGSTTTAEILNIPTPRGPLPETAAPQPGTAPAKPRQVMGNSGGMPR